MRTIITIDGLAGSGKSSLSEALAHRLAFAHLNSGMLYRATSLLGSRNNVALEDGSALESLLRKSSIQLVLDSNRRSRALLDSEDVTDEIYLPLHSVGASQVAKHQVVRLALVNAQRNAFPGESLVAEGRDMGTVIFPDAPVKFFIETDESVRIERRLRQLYGNPALIDAHRLNLLKAEVKSQVQERDARDRQREFSPTVAASSAIIIDNSCQTLTEVVENMYDFAAQLGIVGRSQ